MQRRGDLKTTRKLDQCVVQLPQVGDIHIQSKVYTIRRNLVGVCCGIHFTGKSAKDQEKLIGHITSVDRDVARSSG